MTVTPKRSPQTDDTAVCPQCGSTKKCTGSWHTVCTNCGQVLSTHLIFKPAPGSYSNAGFGRVFAPHSRLKWFEKKMVGRVHSSQHARIRSDFKWVLRCMESNNLIVGRNLTRYEFYLSRLCNRNGVALKDPRKDPPKVNALEDQLFGKVYLLLRWTGEGCHFYARWALRDNYVDP